MARTFCPSFIAAGSTSVIAFFSASTKAFLRFEIKFYPDCAKQLPINGYGVKLSTTVTAAAESIKVFAYVFIFPRGNSFVKFL